MNNLEDLREHFGGRLKKFEPLFEINPKLSKQNKTMLYDVGIPAYSGYGGDFLPADKLTVIEKKFLKFSTKKGQEETFSECIDLDSNKVFFRNELGGDMNFYFLNTDLTTYLEYIQIAEEFLIKIKGPEAYGGYWKNQNHKKYAAELKKRFSKINNDVETSYSWKYLIEEMDLGVI